MVNAPTDPCLNGFELGLCNTVVLALRGRRAKGGSSSAQGRTKATADGEYGWFIVPRLETAAHEYPAQVPELEFHTAGLIVEVRAVCLGLSESPFDVTELFQNLINLVGCALHSALQGRYLTVMGHVLFAFRGPTNILVERDHLEGTGWPQGGHFTTNTLLSLHGVPSRRDQRAATADRG